MKAFTASTYFCVKNEDAFNRFVSNRVIYWTNHISQDKTLSSLNPVDMAISDAIRNPDLITATSITAYHAQDIDRSLAEYRAKNRAPESFRAMFAEV